MSADRKLTFKTGGDKFLSGDAQWTLVLLFTPLDPNKLTQDQLALAWKTQPLQPDDTFKVEYTGVYAVAAGPEKALVDQVIKPGQSTDLKKDGDGKPEFSQPQPYNPPASHKKITVTNKTGGSEDIYFGIVDNEGNFGRASTWDAVGNAQSVEIEFSPILHIALFTPTDSDSVEGEVDTGVIAKYDLTTIGENTTFKIVQDPGSGTISVVTA